MTYFMLSNVSFFLGKNAKLVIMVYLIYNLLYVVSKRTQKSLWYQNELRSPYGMQKKKKKKNLVPTVKFHQLT
jgi:hypothetical protein